MAFTYNSDVSSDLNKVRLLISDTNSTSALFDDAEINTFIALESNIFGAASIACESLAAVYAQKVNKTVGKLKIDLSDKYEHYRGLADKYRGLSKTKGTPQLFAGGISKASKDTYEADTDRVEPSFYRDMHDYDGSVISSTNS